MKKREFTRFVTIQILYSLDVNLKENINHVIINHVIENILRHYKNGDFNEEIGISDDYKLPNIDRDLLDKLVMNTISNQKEIDFVLSKHLKENWTLEKVDILLKNILRIAIYELSYGDVPVKVVIDQYVSLSSCFVDQASVNFVNGILDNISKEVIRI